MALAKVSLDDKYELDRGRVYLTGVQALVRLPIMQRQRDAKAGLNTGCFISGYRGSPLGSFDLQLWQAKRFLSRNNIRFQPGVNEDMAATAVWGSQQVNMFQGAKVDGVFSIWYGKGPGVDRCGDVFKHANNAGTSPHGGVLALAGDDHTCKSSTLPHQSEYAFMDASIPMLHPSGVQEILDYGLYGWAMSRYSGCWTSLKAIAETMDSSASVAVDPERVRIVLPEDFEMPPGGLNIRWPDAPLEQELRLHQAVTEGAVESLNHQGGIHAVIELPADDTTTEQVDPDGQVTPTAAGADVGDVAGPATVGSGRLEVLLQQVLHHPSGSAAGPGASPERSASPGLELGTLHEPGDAMATDLTACRTQLLMDPWGAVEAAVLLEYRLDLSGDHGVLRRQWSRQLLPLPPGVETTAGHIQLTAQPGNGMTT